MLFSYHPEFVTSQTILNGVKDGLSDLNVQIDVEYMDAKRHGSEESIRLFDTWFMHKMVKREPYDLVIASDDNALRYIQEKQAALFSSIPVVFTCINNTDLVASAGKNNLITGVVEQTSIDETINLAKSLQPDLSTIITIADNSMSGLSDLKKFNQVVSQKHNDLDKIVISLGDYSWDELQHYIANLPAEGYAILHLTAFEDKNKKVLNSRDAIHLLSMNALVPVYTLRENFVRAGALGGHVIDFHTQGATAGHMAANILKGTPVQDINVIKESPNRVMINYSLLDRFNINTKLLPKNTILVNKPNGFIVKYRTGIIILSIFMMLLIFILLVLAWKNYIRSHISKKINTMLESLDSGVVLIDADARLAGFNKRFYDLLKIDETTLSTGRELSDLISVLKDITLDSDTHKLSEFESICSANQCAKPFRTTIKTELKTALELRCNAVKGGGLVTSFTDITETHLLSEQLSYQARHDALTGLINRREFEHILHELIITSTYSEQTHVMCYLDLDQFKLINDTCGHQAGDELLRQLSKQLLATIRQSDTLARLGGDEFGLLLAFCSLEQAVNIAEKIREAVEAFRFLWEGNVFTVGVSIGVVLIEKTDVKTVLSAADAACYSAKDRGRNQVYVYSDDDLSILQRHDHMQWAARLRQTLDDDQFVLYQHSIEPIKPMQVDRQRYEILLRIQDEQGNVSPPSQFLSAAERFDLAMLVDQFVLRKTLEWLAADPLHTKKLAMCTINLSGQTVANEKSSENIITLFSETRVDPGLICFEITETAAISNLPNAISLINELKGLGCHFALDDFGSGLSSFGYLKTLPVDYLKIDGSFVRDISNDEVDYAMVKNINEIGKIMGLNTIAEYVENERVLSQLRGIGVDFVQGYFLSKPEMLIN